MRTKTTRIGLTITAFVLLWTTGAPAMDRCKVSIERTSGVLLVDATGIEGALRWGAAVGDETRPFFNSATCIAAGRAKRCQIADPATIDAKTPPAGCTIYLDDAGAPCSSWIRGCTPGPREATITTGAGVVVLEDANGNIVGNVLDAEYIETVREIAGMVVSIPVKSDGSDFLRGETVYYRGADCSGPLLFWGDRFIVKDASVLGEVLYFPPNAGTPTVWGSELFSDPELHDTADCDAIFGQGESTFVATPPTGCCRENRAAASYPLVEPIAVDLSTIGVPPFRIAVR